MKKSIVVIVVVLSLLVGLIFNAFASSGTIYETEPNNNYSTSDTIYDDYNNYGSISSSTDIDYWKFTYLTEKMVNIWLGNIPSGCDFDLYIYNGSQEFILSSSISGNSPELIKLRVHPYQQYYVKIVGFNGCYSSQQYLLRIKSYPVGDAYYFSYNDNSIDTTNVGNHCIQQLSTGGYNSQNYINYNASNVFNMIPSPRILVIDHHGAAGQMLTGNATYIYANAFNGMSSQSRAISNISSSIENTNSLTLFYGCNTGDTDSIKGNLVNSIRSKECFASIGWCVEQNIYVAAEWMEWFSYGLCYLNTPYDAMFYADHKIRLAFSNCEDSSIVESVNEFSNRYYQNEDNLSSISFS